MPAAKTTSLARIAANRRNCQLSTGPMTAEGKARARANAVKHGLTGAGVALPTEDAAAIEARFLQMQEEFAPQTALGAELVHEMAMLVVRKHRAERAEAAHLKGRTRRAAAEFDQARSQRAGQLIEAIEKQPRAYREALREMPEGIDRLIAALEDVRADLSGPAPTWTEQHHRRLDALFGFRPDDFPRNRPTRFSRAILGESDAIGPKDQAPEERVALIGWAMERLHAAIDAEIAALVDHHDSLDLEGIEEDRAGAADGASIDPSRDAELARRYAAAARRELSQTLRDYHLAEALGASPEPETTPPAEPAPPEPNPDSGNDMEPAMASFGRSVAAPPAAPVAAAPGEIRVVDSVDPVKQIPPIRG